MNPVIDLGPLSMRQVRKHYDVDDIITQRLAYSEVDVVHVVKSPGQLTLAVGPLSVIVGGTTETVRVPQWHIDYLDAWERGDRERVDVRNFHQDCGGDDAWMVMWANIKPTEVVDKDTGLDIPLPPGHVVMVNNRATLHRQPHLTRRQAAGRYFIRSVRRVVGQPLLPEDVESIRDQIAAL